MCLRPGEELVAEEGDVLPRFAVGSKPVLEGRHLLAVRGVGKFEGIIDAASFGTDEVKKGRCLDRFVLLVDAGRCEEEVEAC